MEVVETEIADIKLLKPIRHVDSRGFFSEVFRESELREHGIDTGSAKAAAAVRRWGFDDLPTKAGVLIIAFGCLRTNAETQGPVAVRDSAGDR